MCASGTELASAQESSKDTHGTTHTHQLNIVSEDHGHGGLFCRKHLRVGMYLEGVLQRKAALCKLKRHSALRISCSGLMGKEFNSRHY